jgi:hypothetical protein
MARFIEAFWNRGFLWFQRRAEVARCEGIILADVRNTSSHFRNTYLAALQLIRDHDPRRFVRVQRHIHWIFNCHLPIVMAEYDPGTRTCRVNFEEPLDDQDLPLWAGFGACTLIHETTHGIVHARGIHYVAEFRARIERLCVEEENRFVRRLEHSRPELAHKLYHEFKESEWQGAWTASRWQVFSSLLKQLRRT